MFSSRSSRRASSPRVISPSNINRNHIDKHDAGLKGTQGAEDIVKLLRANRSIEYLMLGHNELQDDGCILLFDYLRSEAGRRHRIAEISLNANKIGDAGLWAIARCLEVNKSLTKLFLQNNSFQGDRPIMLRFALAVNRSNLHTLSLTCNPSLSDAVTSTLLPNLSAPRLSELHLSVCSLGPGSTPALLSYLTSPRAYGLHMLKLNGNPLGLTPVKRIVATLERANWSLSWLEMHACSHNSPADASDWGALAAQLQIKVLERNRFLRSRVEGEALTLLRCARIVLLGLPRKASLPLPTELLLYILTFVAPSLSTSQHLRVSAYAASPDTLPSVSLILPPARYSASLSRLASNHTCERGFPGGLASLLCMACARAETRALREDERMAWLRSVGCDRFEAVADPVETAEEGQSETSESME